MKIRSLACLSFLALSIHAGSVLAADPIVGNATAGKQKNGNCAGCHGIEEWRTAYPEVYSVPKLGGQHAAYIVLALQAYKSGARSHPTMRAIAGSLSDQDMADLAAYYATVTAQK